MCLSYFWPWGSSPSSAETSGSSGVSSHFLQVNDSLYELHRPVGTPSVRILFFHGLEQFGDYTDAHWSTWQSEDGSCIWPKTWLVEEIPGAHVLSVTYSGGLRKISDGGVDLYIMGENLLSDILQLQQSLGQERQRPLVLVGHSIGGLVIKQLCYQAHEMFHSTCDSDKTKLEAFLKSLKGIFYYSTPHRGSLVAKRFERNIRMSPLLTYFTALSTAAARLNHNFDKICKWHYKWWKFAGLGETLRTNLGLTDVLVAREASTRGENFNLVEGADHFSICRPRSKVVRSFYSLKDFVNGIANEATAHIHLQDIDNCYVPIENTQAEVISALERGPLVVLLHGGVGKGKTTLARYVCEYYRQQIGIGNIFEHVHFELCGYGSGPDDALCKMRDIMRSLSRTYLDDSGHEEESIWRQRIASAFHKFLKANRVLVILDNVLDAGFLYEMWKVAQGCPDVKYLVTSQLPNLCHDLTKGTQCRIAMRRATEAEARELLATRAGLESGIIPPHLQPIADQMITETEGNPQALASLAEQFNSSENRRNYQAWLDASNNLPAVLNAVEKRVVLGLHYGSPRRSLWTAMELCVKSVSNAKVIFFLIYACHRARISEETLRIWYDCINTSGFTFLKSREELHLRELLEPHSVELGFMGSQLEGEDSDQELHMSTEWSLRPLVKLYMNHLMAGKTDMVMRKEIMDAMGSLVGALKLRVESGIQPHQRETTETLEGEEAKVAIVLCALYFDSSHADQVVSDSAMMARSASEVGDKLDCNWIHLRSEAIEPIVWLLGQPKHKEWTNLITFSARKVFLTYICERQLDGDGFSTLLKFDAYPPAQLATLRALLSIFTVEETPLPWQHARLTLKALLALLDSNGRCSTSVQEATSKALVPMLEILFRFLSQNNKADLRLQAALALIVLTVGHEASIGQKLVKEDGAVAGLVKSWSQHGEGDWQEQVIGALYDLARQEGDSIKFAIVHEEGVLAALVKALVEHNNGNLQEVAARAFKSLAVSDKQSILSKIGNEEGAISGLVKCLSVEDKPALQEQAAAALTNITVRNVPNKVAVANEPGALAALVKLISEHDSGIVRGHAAGVIWNLVGGESTDRDWIRMKISNEGGIAALVKALFVQENPILQERAAGALAGLAYGEDIVFFKQMIANESKAITGLVKLLSEQNKGSSRRQAGRALRNLVFLRKLPFPADHKEILLKIGCEDGALASLVECLSEPVLQEHAIMVLTFLALTEDKSLVRKIRNENGLLTAVVSLSQHDTPFAQNYAKPALEALGGMDGAT